MPSDSHDPMHQPLAAQPAAELWTSPFEALLKQELPTLHPSNGSSEIQQPDPIVFGTNFARGGGRGGHAVDACRHEDIP